MAHKLLAENVRAEYDTAAGNTVLALNDVNLTIAPGEFVCIVGPSGCGKTTFLNIVSGLVPLSGGRILLDGKPLEGPGRNRSQVFQSPSLLPWRNTLGNVLWPMELQGVRAAEAHKQALSHIELVGLKGFENQYPHELSGGMQQRVNLARALALNPDLLLLDEPFAALDAQTRENMQQELLRIWGATRKTALFITHQIDEAILLADRVFVLSGRPGTVKAVLPINLPRPRTLRIKRDPAFLALVDEIQALIDDETSVAAGA
jgi:NitT/TauT family transport system ATP-binding protein